MGPCQNPWSRDESLDGVQESVVQCLSASTKEPFTAAYHAAVKTTWTTRPAILDDAAAAAEGRPYVFLSACVVTCERCLAVFLDGDDNISTER
ncbi:hypothetical protein E2C01_055095 [Portunus trituberculatus]|uniref:Uncharacterized protein n=1 Tax=Portunus trituberculatus TaxID=210409 RepID=A0A5B7GQ99_PORTR|nr:hypothetical protein [Portunus trituberculatus]